MISRFEWEKQKEEELEALEEEMETLAEEYTKLTEYTYEDFLADNAYDNWKNERQEVE